MKYRLLGNSGLRVSELALGAMTFGMPGWGVERTRAGACTTASARRRQLVDTANLYSGGRSETFLGEFLAGARADRARHQVHGRDAQPRCECVGNNRKNMMDAVHASLSRLSTDYIDLYWCTRATTHADRRGDARARRPRAPGKILYAGISDTPAWEVSRANMLAELRGWTAFVGLQIKYSDVKLSITAYRSGQPRFCRSGSLPR